MAAVEDFDTGLRPDELDALRPRPVETPWGTMALYVVGRDVRAFQAFCPHMSGPLFAGTLAGSSVTCPWHLWRYSLEDGRLLETPTDTPARGAPLVRCPTRVGARGTIVLGSPARPSNDPSA